MTYEDFICLKPGDAVQIKPLKQIKLEYGSIESIPGEVGFALSMIKYCGQILTVRWKDDYRITCEEAKIEGLAHYWYFTKEMLNSVESESISLNLDTEWENMIFSGIEDLHHD